MIGSDSLIWQPVQCGTQDIRLGRVLGISEQWLRWEVGTSPTFILHRGPPGVNLGGPLKPASVLRSDCKPDSLGS